jgi:hypothetical protein
MSRRDNQTSLSEFPSIFSSSILIDDLSLRNELSLRFLNLEENNNLYGFDSFEDIRAEELAHKRRASEEGVGFELKRCTSFEEILMENHRNVLIESMKEYFSKIEHRIVKRYQTRDIKYRRMDEDELELEINHKELEISRIIHEHEGELLSKIDILAKCRENSDEIHVIYDVMNICPEELEFEVLYLIAHIYAECSQIIQHFRRKNLSWELKNRSTKLAQELLQEQCLGKLFESSLEKKVAGAFEVLVEKWAITLFLMKVGVFENELETKSIEECLRS